MPWDKTSVLDGETRPVCKGGSRGSHVGLCTSRDRNISTTIGWIEQRNLGACIIGVEFGFWSLIQNIIKVHCVVCCVHCTRGYLKATRKTHNAQSAEGLNHSSFLPRGSLLFKSSRAYKCKCDLIQTKYRNCIGATTSFSLLM